MLMLRTAISAAALLFAACAPPDVPRELPAPLSAEAIRLLEPDTTRAVRIAEGVVYRFVWSPVGPWAVHVLEAELNDCGIGFAVVRAPAGSRTVSDLLRLAPESRVAGVNGGFFTEAGTPTGIEVSTLGVRGSGSGPAFVWDPGAGPWIGNVVRDGGIVTGEGRRLFTERSVPEGLSVVSGLPELLDRGRPVGDLEVSARPEFAGVRHPRTAIGFSERLRRLWIVVVEGRGGSYSVGMTLPELAGMMASMGAEEALNLDGGGSSAMVIGGRTVSHPSQGGVEQRVANALVVLSSAGVEPLRGESTPRCTRGREP